MYHKSQASSAHEQIKTSYERSYNALHGTHKSSIAPHTNLASSCRVKGVSVVQPHPSTLRIPDPVRLMTLAGGGCLASLTRRSALHRRPTSTGIQASALQSTTKALLYHKRFHEKYVQSQKKYSYINRKNK